MRRSNYRWSREELLAWSHICPECRYFTGYPDCGACHVLCLEIPADIKPLLDSARILGGCVSPILLAHGLPQWVCEDDHPRP